MKILVVTAMPIELKAIKDGIKSANLKENLDIDYLCCGIGNYETIYSLEHYLTMNREPTFIWNIGICGYWNQNYEEKSEPIQVASVINIHTEKEMILPPFLQLESMKTCFSSENVIYNKPKFSKKIGMISEDEMYFDMESRGVAFIASKYKYPHLILKVPFDFIGSEQLLSGGSLNENSVKIFNLLCDLPYHDYLQKILVWIKQQYSD